MVVGILLALSFFQNLKMFSLFFSLSAATVSKKRMLSVLDAAHAHAVTKFSRAAACENGREIRILEIKNETISDNSERNNFDEEIIEEVEEEKEAVK